jgi:hypothetical protein
VLPSVKGLGDNIKTAYTLSFLHTFCVGTPSLVLLFAPPSSNHPCRLHRIS